MYFNFALVCLVLLECLSHFAQAAVTKVNVCGAGTKCTNSNGCPDLSNCVSCAIEGPDSFSYAGQYSCSTCEAAYGSGAVATDDGTACYCEPGYFGTFVKSSAANGLTCKTCPSQSYSNTATSSRGGLLHALADLVSTVPLVQRQ